MDRRRTAFYIIAVLALGFSGISAQTVLLRELLILFSGNELSIGAIVGSWVICEAAGSLAAGRFAGRLKDKAGSFIFLTVFFSALFPASIYLARVFRGVAGIPPEVGIGLWPVIYSSFLILLPTGFLHGFLFVSACSLQGLLPETRPSVGKVYYYETLGTIIGGLATAYLLIPLLNSFETAFLIAFLNGAACLALVRVFRVPLARPAALSAVLLTAASVIFPVSGAVGRMHQESIGRQWQGRSVVLYENSFYQNISVVKDEGQYTFYTDGVPHITTPVPDISSVEDLAHLPLLSHPKPENVLVISGGAGGILNEVLKHPSVRRADYAEIDPMLLAAIGSFPTPLTRKEFGDPKVHTHFVDGRVFIKDAPVKYDVIILGLKPPRTLQENRYFTEEFFETARRALAPGGIIALAVPGSLTYYGDELLDLNACILTTLKKAFPHAFVFPGDNNIFLASPTPGIENISPALLASRLQSRGLRTGLITEPYIRYRLDESTRRWFGESEGQARVPANTDFSPAGMLLANAYENLMFSPWVNRLFSWIKGRLNLLAFASAVLLLATAAASRKAGSSAIPLAMAATGFTSMALEILLIMGFQIFYGQVFAAFGLLVTAFMGGMAAGSFASEHRAPEKDFRLFLAADAGLAAFALVIPGVFYLLDSSAFNTGVRAYGLFLPLLFVSGALTGTQFPLAGRLYASSNRGGAESLAGLIYGADLIGGWAGGVMGGLLLLPLLGFYKSFLLLAALKAWSFLMLYFSRKPEVEL